METLLASSTPPELSPSGASAPPPGAITRQRLLVTVGGEARPKTTSSPSSSLGGCSRTRGLQQSVLQGGRQRDEDAGQRHHVSSQCQLRHGHDVVGSQRCCSRFCVTTMTTTRCLVCVSPGPTLSELKDAFSLPCDGQTLLDGYKVFVEQLQESKDFALSMANR